MDIVFSGVCSAVQPAHVSTPDPNMIRPLITATISLSVVIYFIVICIGGLDQNFVENGWQIISATVLDPDIDLEGRTNKQRKNDGLEQVLNYEYEVGSVKYRSNSVSREVFVDLSDYTQGKTIDIYLNPNEPTESVIVRTPVPKQYLYGFIGTCFVVMFIILYCLIRDLKACRNP